MPATSSLVPPPRRVGLIANPLSGKDIRRIVAQATVFPNHEKVNILRRILLGLAAVGVDEVLVMPDQGGLVERACERLELPFPVQSLPMPIFGTADDTSHAAGLMRTAAVRCLVVLGGDGTCRAVARSCGEVPLLPVSTGTNNAFPRFIEGTLAGMAAASLAAHSAPELLLRAPALELLCADEVVDLALVDVAAMRGGLGARAIWEVEHLSLVVTTRLQPGTVGLSAIGGAIGAAAPAETQAVAVWLGQGQRSILAPIAPGMVQRLPLAATRWLAAGERVALPAASVVALDGEREYQTRDQRWEVRLTSAGPYVVLVERALQALYSRGEGYD